MPAAGSPLLDRAATNEAVPSLQLLLIGWRSSSASSQPQLLLACVKQQGYCSARCRDEPSAQYLAHLMMMIINEE